MTRSASITVRVDEQTKKEATEIAHDVGLNLSSAITLFLRQIVIRKEIPLTLVSSGRTINRDNPLILKADPKYGHVVLPKEDSQDTRYYNQVYGDVN
ncbi:MAG: type II toxin-antitoxin system RelB/DinJ family antitoxin [Actinomycetes bacterium]|jgi:addiction module RelB/DinJ family antitoxin|nr:type II toxin-antitoxin system RelB/DinJ family antitoxin [Actinomycetes bacterium]